MLFRRVRADHEDRPRLGYDVVHGVGHRTRAQGISQCHHGGRVAQPRAVIDVVGADLAGEFWTR
jgi:hypothetical protein